MTTSTPGPAVDLIEHAAGIIVAKQREKYTAPYHWAGALWEAGMLVAPGTAPKVQPSADTAAEAGKSTAWDTAHREGRAWAYEALLGVNTRFAHRWASEYLLPPCTRLVRLGAWLLRREIERIPR
ncbi:MAG TPA: hypothetical protein VGW74_13120 [Propionibacteriaceae bacterium]|nr:hypothetical protein [Propionibacteriaceae bacterium]